MYLELDLDEMDYFKVGVDELLLEVIKPTKNLHMEEEIETTVSPIENTLIGEGGSKVETVSTEVSPKSAPSSRILVSIFYK